jgi:WD40 repeat protein
MTLVAKRFGTGAVIKSKYSKDNKVVLVATTDKKVALYDVLSMTKISMVESLSPVVSVDIANDNRHAAFGTSQGELFLWDVVTNQLLLLRDERIDNLLDTMKEENLIARNLKATAKSLLESEIKPIAFSPSGRYLAVSGYRTTFEVLLTTIEKGNTEGAFLFHSPIIIWDVISKKPIYTLSNDDTSITQFKFSDNECFLVSLGGSSYPKVWDIGKGNLFFELKDHDSSTINVVFSQDSKYIASEGVYFIYVTDLVNKTTRTYLLEDLYRREEPDTSQDWFTNPLIYSSKKSEIKLTNYFGSINDLSMTRDTLLIAAASEDRRIHIWDSNKEIELKTLGSFSEGNEDDTYYYLSFSPGV